MSPKRYGWKHGDAVTKPLYGGEATLGKVVQLSRRSDGKPFLMVEVIGGLGQLGSRQWLDGWVLGMGRFRADCLSCEQPFYTNDPKKAEAEFCPACDRQADQEVAADSGIRSPVRYMRGAATPHRVARRHSDEELDAIARERAADEKESIF